MIDDALAGKIDRIVTKSVSRFARNTVDTLTTIRKLKEKGVGVTFEKENIDTLDSKGELLITIMSSLAQEESRSISENVTWGWRKRISDGKVSVAYSHFLGYEKGEDGSMQVVESEAKIVQQIYGMFLDGQTPSSIASFLTKQRVPTPAGKEKWQSSTVKSILTNEKYKGDALLQKTFTVDFLSKKAKLNEGEVPQYYVEHSHPAIIDRAMFELVGLRAGFYHPWFNDNCSVLVPEADIGAGLITYLLKLISGKNVNFLEPFHIESDYGTFAGGHAGPNDHNDPAWQQNVVIARDVRFAKTSYKYAGAPFAWYRISPGRKTMAQLVECDGRYKLVATLVDSLEGDHILATYSHSIFRPVVPVERLFEEILKIGTTQHFAIVDGDYLRELGMLAEIMDFEYHEIMN